MTEQDRKFLTEWLGEKWYTDEERKTAMMLCYCCCSCDCSPERTFTTPTDVQALVDRLKEKGLLHVFDVYIANNELVFSIADWLEELPEQQCQLIADFLKSLEVE